MMAGRAGARPLLLVHWVNQYAVPPDQPGGTRHHDMAAELRRNRIDARIVASDLNLTTRTYSRRRSWWSLRSMHEDVGHVPFTWLSAGSYSANDWRRVSSMVVFSAIAFLELLRVEVRRGSTVMIGSSPHLFAALATWAAARARRVPFVLEIRDLWPESYTEMTGRSTGLEVRLLRAIADLLYRRAAAVLVLAPAVVERVVSRGADAAQVHVIPNGVDLASFDGGGEPPIRLGRDGRFTFVYAGAHGRANGLDVVLEACRLLQLRGQDTIAVALIGDGPSKTELLGRAQEVGLRNVAFHHPVAKGDVPAVLRTADAGLMVLAPVDLFSYGVSPNKLFDYLACGLPVVTNVPGWVASIVEASGAGLVAPAGDAAALADTMVELARRQQDVATTLPSGRPHVSQHFDRHRLAGQLATVLVEVCSRP